MYRATRTVIADNRCLLLGSVVAFFLLWHLLLGSLPPDRVSRGVAVWWTALCAASIVNLCCWRVSAIALARRMANAEPTVYLYQRRQLVLSAIYVLGCGFRAILPRADVQRIGLYDSWASSVMVGRSVATVAELCFVIQWALLLHVMAHKAEARFARLVAWLLVPLIVVAEMCSWYSVLTTSYIGNTCEESLWAISVTLLLISFVTLWPRTRPSCRRFLGAAICLGTAYVAFMVTVDVPMYFTRWLADEASGRQYLSLSQGLIDVWSRWIVTFDWESWHMEMPWMTLYFTVAVWCSIALAHAPWFEAKARFES
jgi:hypothetical protein